MHPTRTRQILKLAAQLSPNEPDEDDDEDKPQVTGQLPPMGMNMLPKLPGLKPFKMPKLSPLPPLQAVAQFGQQAQPGQQQADDEGAPPAGQAQL